MQQAYTQGSAAALKSVWKSFARHIYCTLSRMPLSFSQVPVSLADIVKQFANFAPSSTLYVYAGRCVFGEQGKGVGRCVLWGEGKEGGGVGGPGRGGNSGVVTVLPAYTSRLPHSYSSPSRRCMMHPCQRQRDTPRQEQSSGRAAGTATTTAAHEFGRTSRFQPAMVHKQAMPRARYCNQCEGRQGWCVNTCGWASGVPA